jgi:hypothetical protein
LASLSNGKCSCVENSSYSSSTSKCVCSSGFQEHSERCVACRNYYKSSEVSARFNTNNSSIIVTFTRAAISFTSNSCSNFINSASLTKLGNNPICAWNTQRTMLTITRGTSSTISNEALSLKELVLVASGTACNYSPEILAPIISSSVAKTDEELQGIGDYIYGNEDENSEDCERNLSPAVIIILTFGIYGLAYVLISRLSRVYKGQMGLRDKRYEISANNLEVSSNYQTGNQSEPTDNSVEIRPTAQIELSNLYFSTKLADVSKTSQNNKTEISKPQSISNKSFYQFFKERHFICRLIKGKNTYEQKYLLFSILSILLLQYAILGALYAAFQDLK